jgi:Na+-translocating ferredoxin:NAD+ oxidoreductase RNF subunit RnfB
MNDTILMIGIPILILGGLGLVLGLILAYSAKAFEVKIDERIKYVRSVLPGANCGACGQAGCDSFAEAAVEGKVKPDGCPVGGATVAENVAKILGVTLTNTVSTVARVACGGHTSVSRTKYAYDGILSCTAASTLHNGPKACAFGCLGFGDCVAACPFDAIVIEDGVARILENKCRSCEACVAACPKKLISMVPRGKNYVVACKSTQKGPATKKACDVGCIGCGKCVKVCPHQAITMANNLARIDPLLCQNCGECVEVCPTSAIQKIGTRIKVIEKAV